MSSELKSANWNIIVLFQHRQRLGNLRPSLFEGGVRIARRGNHVEFVYLSEGVCVSIR